MKKSFIFILLILFQSFLFSDCLDDGCQIQIINNTQSLVLDIYIDNNQTISSLEHRSATDMFLLPDAGTYTIGIALAGEEVISDYESYLISSLKE